MCIRDRLLADGLIDGPAAIGAAGPRRVVLTRRGRLLADAVVRRLVSTCGLLHQAQGEALRTRVDALNAARIEAFGASRMEMIGRVRIRTEHNCVARDIVQVLSLIHI